MVGNLAVVRENPENAAVQTEGLLAYLHKTITGINVVTKLIPSPNLRGGIWVSCHDAPFKNKSRMKNFLRRGGRVGGVPTKVDFVEKGGDHIGKFGGGLALRDFVLCSRVCTHRKWEGSTDTRDFPTRASQRY